jgi:acyl-CoA synthetase (AMP-forming)/AMP-acid ligase II
MGVKKGDVLGVLSWNCLEYMDVFGAAEKGGFIIAPFNARLLLNDFEYLINDSEANTLFVGPEFADTVNTLKPRIPKVKHFICFEGSLPGMKRHTDLLASYPTSEPDTEWTMKTGSLYGIQAAPPAVLVVLYTLISVFERR